MNWLVFMLVMIIVLLVIVGSIAIGSSGSSRGDDSDPPNGRSGVDVRVDHLTGCEYLEGSRGGITPRLDGNGKHICRKERP